MLEKLEMHLVNAWIWIRKKAKSVNVFLLAGFSINLYGLCCVCIVGGVAVSDVASWSYEEGSRGPAEGAGRMLVLSYLRIFCSAVASFIQYCSSATYSMCIYHTGKCRTLYSQDFFMLFVPNAYTGNLKKGLFVFCTLDVEYVAHELN